MATSLLSNINSESQHQANILTNSPNLVKVMVEDEIDVVIWHRILTHFAPKLNFDVHPYSYDSDIKGKGKAQILAQANQFGRYFIGCVDSDYDWILKHQTVFGNIINITPYILQTYAYSVENLAAQPYAIVDCMLECYLHSCELLRHLDSDYNTFLLSLSKDVYDILIWHLTMIEKQEHLNQIPTGRDFIFGNNHYSDILGNHTMPIGAKHKAILSRFSNRTRELAQHYAVEYPQLLLSYSELKETLYNECNLSPENAYLYVRGHNLYDFLLHNFFNPVQIYLRTLHEDEIRSHTKRKEISNAIRHYNNLIKDFSRDYIHRVAYIWDKNNPISQQIKNDIDTLFNPE